MKQRVLVVHSWGLGDLIMATPMLRTLHENGFVVDLILMSKANMTIVKEAPFIHKIYLLKNYFEFVKFFKKYDYLIFTAGTNPKKAMVLNLLVFAKKVIASFQMKKIHRVEMNLKMIEPLVDKKVYEPYLYITNSDKIVSNYIKNDQKNIGFAIGSGAKQKFKRWDIENYKKLMHMFEGNILVFIGPDEPELSEELKGMNHITVIEENLENTIKIISRLDFLIGNDNGLMHIGYASGITTFTIFGMSDERESGGRDKRRNHPIFLDMVCRPCFHTKYRRVSCPDYRCLHELRAESVYQIVMEKLRA